MNNDKHLEMISKVADALGEEMLRDVVFVGGSTTGILVTDEYVKETVRFTDDVDLIVSLIGVPQWYQLQDKLKKKGFKESLEDDVICRMRLGDLKVDFMPDDEKILKFGNPWYERSFRSAEEYELNGKRIKVVTGPCFVATKIQAYLGRGNNDPLGSHDIEDLLVVVDGREGLAEEIRKEDPDLIVFVAENIKKIMSHDDFDFVVKGMGHLDEERSDMVFERLEEMAELKVDS